MHRVPTADAAQLDRTFHAFADPELKRRWFGAPESWADANWELDFRVGGAELSVGRDPGGTLHEFRSRYHDIVDGQRIVFAYDLLLDSRLLSVSLTTVEIRPDGDGTRLVFTEHGAFFDDLEDPAEREHGTRLLPDGLAAFPGQPVAARAARTRPATCRSRSTGSSPGRTRAASSRSGYGGGSSTAGTSATSAPTRRTRPRPAG